MDNNKKYSDIIIYAPRNSNSARKLATNIDCRRWRDSLPERYQRRSPNFSGNNGPLVINWGSSTYPSWADFPGLKLIPTILNPSDKVKTAIDKLEFFQTLSKANAGVPLLKWTTDISVAKGWLAKGVRVVCRQNLKGSSGVGIVIASTVEEVVPAPLYTRYYPKTHEFRIHVFKGKVIDLTQKKLRGELNAQGNRLIRSLDNGWVHAHAIMGISDGDRRRLEESACLCTSTLGLDFGAVDVLSKFDTQSPRRLVSSVICEVNTAPGLENNITISAYSDAIIEARNSLIDRG